MAERGFLFGVGYPLYSVCRWRDDDVFMIAGGGGKAKTGIKNGVEFHKLLSDKTGGSLYSHTCISRHYTDSNLWMQFCTNPCNAHMLATSIDAECRIYNIRKERSSVEEVGNTKNDDLHSNKKESSSKETAVVNQFELIEVASAITDYTSSGPFQNVVRFSHDGSHVLTGGQDGVVRVWKLPDLELLCSRNAHKGEITDIATHPTKELSVSISRDATAKVWESLTNKKEKKDFTARQGHRFRACGFSNFEGYCHFFGVSIPVKWVNKSRQYCYLTKWDCEKWVELRSVKTGSQLITSMAIYNGYIGIGDTDGSVSIFTTNLKLLQKVTGLHSSSVTNLCFMPSSAEHNLVLLSVSVDKSCCATEVKEKGSGAVWKYVVVILALVVLLLAVYVEFV